MGVNFEQMDRYFKKQLRNYTQSAPGDVWENIELALNSNQKAKRIIIYKIAAAIAAFAIIGSGFLYFSPISNNIDQNEMIVENNSLLNSTHETEIHNQGVGEKQDLVSTETSITSGIDVKTDVVNTELITKAELPIREAILTDSKIEKRTDNLEKLTQKKIIISEEIVALAIIDNRVQNVKSYLNTLPDIYTAYTLNDLFETKETKNNKWVLGGEFSPLYSYRHIAETGGDTYSKDFYNSTENPIMSYTGGLNLQYKTPGRFTIQAGVYYTTMGQSMDYMSVYSNSAYNLVDEEYKDRFISSYSITNSVGNVSFNSPYVIVDEKSARVINNSDNKATVDLSDPIFNNLSAEIQQNFQYVEVPVLMRYKLIDKNVDINLVGGFGANFLVGNDVILKYGSNKEIVGQTNGVNSINYNGTLGFGIEYPLMDKLNIRLEPSIKYYLNEINSSSSVESHPYSIGIYTGINYSF
ncbi:MAG TPA: hypothetical protein DCG75_19830 [Bacteroidales bacterium]|nr:hypothetical protein [Bacteroidales bacterium]